MTKNKTVTELWFYGVGNDVIKKLIRSVLHKYRGCMGFVIPFRPSSLKLNVILSGFGPFEIAVRVEDHK